MRQVYINSWSALWATGDSGYIFSDRIEPGKLLHVHSAFAYAPERDASDKITIGVRHGGKDIILRAQATLAVQLGSEFPSDFFVGEGDQVFAYFANAEDGDTIGIHVNGVIMPLAEWETMPE